MVKLVLEMIMKKFFKVNSATGIISDFKMVNPDVRDDEVPEDSDFFYWVEYVDKFEPITVDDVEMAKWTLVIGEKEWGDLEDLKIGAIYRSDIPYLLPNVDFGTLNPAYFVFDVESGEWKSPVFDASGMKIWDAGTRDYVPLQAE